VLLTFGCSVALVMSMKEPSSPSRGCMCIRVQKSCSFLDRGGWALFQTGRVASRSPRGRVWRRGCGERGVRGSCAAARTSVFCST